MGLSGKWFPTLLLAALLQASCSWLPNSDGLDIGPTLGQLASTPLPPEDHQPAVRLTIDQVDSNYRQALAVTTDPLVRRKIMIRLADLEMARAEQRLLDTEQLDASGSNSYFDSAITLYQQLLDTAPGRDIDPAAGTDGDERDVLLYLLAKAYSLAGKRASSTAALDRITLQHPQSLFAVEAEFRRGEKAFSEQQYARAERSYAAVVAAGEQTPYYDNAIYMHGWSQFKQNQLRASLQSFTQVLDKLARQAPQLETLSGPAHSLLSDTLRVMGLVFSYMHGAESISSAHPELAERPYVHLLYRQLAALYLEKDRYRDSAETYQHFASRHPFSDYAPEFSVKAIEVFQQGNFPTLVLPAKEAFVRHYGIYSDYWQQKGPAQRQGLLPQLREYLRQLAEYQHALAQAQQQVQQQAQPQAQRRDSAGGEPDGQNLRPAREHFLLAADWYQQFVETFPDAPETPEMRFLMAEARFEAGAYAAAYADYEAVAYPAGGFPAESVAAGSVSSGSVSADSAARAAEAGYSAILALDKHLASLHDQAQLRAWQQRKIASARRFADAFGSDARAPRVLAQAAQLLLQDGQKEEAIVAATRLTQWLGAIDGALRKSAWLVIGQSQFDLQRFAAAEQAYQQVLALLPAAAADRADIVERIAASVYQLAGQQLQSQDAQASVEHLLRVREVAPGSAIALKAHYDALNQLLTLQDWERAERESLAFRRSYPGSELTPSLAPKLVVIYEAQGNWQAAADELITISKADGEPEVRRNALLLAADYYQRGGNTSAAINHYRSYAHTYPEPFAEVMEARFKMTELYALTAELGKRRYWLRKLIAGDAAAGAARSERSRYLGAFASAALADDRYRAFVDIPLRLPLKSSLQKKHKALQQALQAYEQVLAYDVAEFTTLAGFRLGEVYAQLSRDLLQSQRPPNLDGDALAQYDMLLEEQAYPFEEQAIAIHQRNAQRSWDGFYDQWVQASIEELAQLLPARYGKREQQLEYADEIY
ncbi:MAG: Clp protease ClpB [Gammaproteobacteria bacterium]|nr:Clp protease ClpB [Gammaproteobacteria bacterium]